MNQSIYRLRRRAYARQSHACYYCQRPMWITDCAQFAQIHGLSHRAARQFQCSAEHLIPVSLGGGDTPANVVAACIFCNRTRHKARKIRTGPEFAVYVRRRIAGMRWNYQFRRQVLPRSRHTRVNGRLANTRTICMTDNRIPHSAVHRDMDPHFFTDYALFSGAFRHYVGKSIEDEYRRNPNDIHKRLLIVGLYREEYSAYEDLGAVLEALIRFRSKELDHPVAGILAYKVDKVVLENLFSRRKICSADDLFAALGLLEGVEASWRSVYPRIDCAAVLQRMCGFIYKDCKAGQSRYGVEAYNRIKHGLAFLPNGKRYLRGLPDAPAVMIPTRDPNSPNPYTLLGLPIEDAALEQRARVIEFIQSTTRALVGFYLIGRYPNFLRDERKIDPAPALFSLPSLVSVLEFLQQLNDKPEQIGV